MLFFNSQPLSFLLLIGYASFQPSIPEGYSGPAAVASDTYSNHRGSTAHFFLSRVDENSVENSAYKTRVANTGRGFDIIAGVRSCIVHSACSSSSFTRVFPSTGLGNERNTSRNMGAWKCTNATATILVGIRASADRLRPGSGWMVVAGTGGHVLGVVLHAADHWRCACVLFAYTAAYPGQSGQHPGHGNGVLAV